MNELLVMKVNSFSSLGISAATIRRGLQVAGALHDGWWVDPTTDGSIRFNRGNAEAITVQAGAVDTDKARDEAIEAAFGTHGQG